MNLHKMAVFKKQITVRDEVTGLIELLLIKKVLGLMVRKVFCFGIWVCGMFNEDVMIPRADIVSVDITDGFRSVIR